MSREDHKGPVKVTITDPESGEVLEEKVLRDDFAVITAGNRYIKHTQIWGSTVGLHIAVDHDFYKRQQAEEEKNG